MLGLSQADPQAQAIAMIGGDEMLTLTSRRLARDTPVGDQNLPALPSRAPGSTELCGDQVR